jgi:hypothetical protein
MSNKKERPFTILWRDAVRDSGIDKLDKLVAHTIATYFNGSADKPQERSYRTIARDASMSERTVSTAVGRLEGYGFIAVRRSSPKFDKRGRLARGGHAHVYNLRLPDPTLHRVPRQRGRDDAPDATSDTPDVAPDATSTWHGVHSDVAPRADVLEVKELALTSSPVIEGQSDDGILRLIGVLGGLYRSGNLDDTSQLQQAVDEAGRRGLQVSDPFEPPPF